MIVPVIKLLLAGTNIPEDAFPTDQTVLLPTYTRLTVKDETLNVDLILRDPDEEEEYGFPAGLPDFNWHNRPVLALKLKRDEVVRLVVERSWTSSPIAMLYIRDPLGVYDELYLRFDPWSKNNTGYHIDAFAQMLRRVLNLPVQYEEKPPEPDFPF